MRNRIDGREDADGNLVRPVPVPGEALKPMADAKDFHLRPAIARIIAQLNAEIVNPNARSLGVIVPPKR